MMQDIMVGEIGQNNIGQGDIAFQQKLYDDPNATRRNLHRARKAWIERRLDAALTSPQKVLEVGVGCGTFTRYLSEKNATVHAVDINQQFLDGVAGLPGVEVLNADATKDLGLRDIDIAVCSEVLEHVPPRDSQSMLQQFASSLKPGGMLILTTPQRYSSVEMMVRLFRFPFILAIAKKLYGTAEDLGHINLLTNNELRKQIAQAGFIVAEQDFFGFYLPFIAEFGGETGSRFQQSLGRALKHIPVLKNLLWTQAFILVKP